MLTYQNVTPQQIEDATAKIAAQQGMEVYEVQENVYRIEAYGFTITATYLPPSQTLEVNANILIRGKVDSAIKSALGR
jgi:hypothetical protein